MASLIPPVGFVGLGHMGSILAANLVDRGFDVIAYDAAAGARAALAGATSADSVATVALNAEVVVLSLPDGEASIDVCQQIVNADRRESRTRSVVDTSTIGVQGTRRAAGILQSAGIDYFDAPVSGGLAGARARTLMVMYSGPPEAGGAVEAVLAGLSDRRKRVGGAVGLAQALKLANNFLAAVTLIATSEAVAFGTAAGLDMAVMVEALNSSSGQSAATTDKFPNHVLTGRYAAGFTNTLMAKDMALFVEEASAQAQPDQFAAAAAAIWKSFAADEPGADFTRIYPYIKNSGRTQQGDTHAGITGY